MKYKNIYEKLSLNCREICYYLAKSFLRKAKYKILVVFRAQ